MMSFGYFHNMIRQFSGMTVLVVGDLILDVYLKGNTSRICPEAPVPVVDILEEHIVPGGAANVAMNLRALGAKVRFLGVSGDDESAKKALQLFVENDIQPAGLIKDVERTTIVKERIIAGGQILVRLDKGSENKISKEKEDELMRSLSANAPLCNVILLADYDKGTLTTRVIQHLKLLREKYPVFLAVDSKRLDEFEILKPDVVKPNYEEAVQLLGMPRLSRRRMEQIRSHGGDISKLTGAKMAVVTLDDEGAMAFSGSRFVGRVPARRIAEPMVSGAGDTFISALSLALASGAGLGRATKLATAASYIAVNKEDTSCCTDKELCSYFTLHHKQVTGLEEMRVICDMYHAGHKKVIFTNGCFDILHSGHVNYLHRAAEMGDILIVGINSDESIKRLKGADRPVNSVTDRIKVLSALESVNHVIVFGNDGTDLPVGVIEAVRPDIFVKGGDYIKCRLPEAETVESLGGDVRFIPLTPDHSTTDVIDKIHRMAV